MFKAGTCVKPTPGRIFSENFPGRLLKVSLAQGRNFDGVWHEPWKYQRWSRALCRALRHSKFLTVDDQGFAYVEDIVHVLSDTTTYHLSATDKPTVADLVFIVATQDKGRYEAASLKGKGNIYDLLIRCVQGHSGNIARQLVREKAFTQVTSMQQVPFLIHHTKSENLMPGGKPATTQGEWERRADIHCSITNMSATGEIPDNWLCRSFRRKSNDERRHTDLLERVWGRFGERQDPSRLHLAGSLAVTSASDAVQQAR